MSGTNVDFDVFNQQELIQSWWDPNGKWRTLHDIQAIRLNFIIENLRNFLPNNWKAMDLGCGGGILTEDLAKIGFKTTGIDTSKELINIAQNHALEQNLNIEYENINSKNWCLKYPETKFNVVTCLELLEHVEDYSQVLQHCRQMLVNGGHLFLSTINRTWTAYLQAVIGAEYVLNIIPKNTHKYRLFIKPSELIKNMRQLNFIPIKLIGLQYNPFNRSAKLTNNCDINFLIYARLEI